MLSRDAEDELIAFLRLCYRDDRALGCYERWKEEVLNEAIEMLGGDPYCCGLSGEKILRLLAEPYRDHTGHREEWLL